MLAGKRNFFDLEEMGKLEVPLTLIPRRFFPEPEEHLLAFLHMSRLNEIRVAFSARSAWSMQTVFTYSRIGRFSSRTASACRKSFVTSNRAPLHMISRSD